MSAIRQGQAGCRRVRASRPPGHRRGAPLRPTPPRHPPQRAAAGLLALWFRIVTGFAAAFRHARLAGLPIVLAVLVAMSTPATPQVNNCPDGLSCPVFSPSTALTFRISEGAGSGEVIGMLPTATDADRDEGQILAYDLWDRDDPIEHGNREETDFGDGDASAFELDEYYYLDEDDVIRVRLTLKTNHDYDFETKRVYEFRLVACDNDYNRGYIDLTVRVDNVNEDLGRPDAPTVEGVSTMKLVVRWTAPSNMGPPITDYDLEYRQKNPVGGLAFVVAQRTANERRHHVVEFAAGHGVRGAGSGAQC